MSNPNPIVPPDLSFIEQAPEPVRTLNGGILDLSYAVAIPRVEWEALITLADTGVVVPSSDPDVSFVALDAMRLGELNYSELPVFAMIMSIASRTTPFMLHEGQFHGVRFIIPSRLRDSFTHAVLNINLTYEGDEYNGE